MFWCQPGCACCAGTRPLFVFSKGTVTRGVVLYRVTAQGNLWLGHLHSCFCPSQHYLIWQHLWPNPCYVTTSRNSQLDSPSSDVSGPSLPIFTLGAGGIFSEKSSEDWDGVSGKNITISHCIVLIKSEISEDKFALSYKRAHYHLWHFVLFNVLFPFQCHLILTFIPGQ